MVIATMQTSEPIKSHYQKVHFTSIELCAVYLGENKIKLTHELIHVLDDLRSDKLMDLEFSCVANEGVST